MSRRSTTLALVFGLLAVACSGDDDGAAPTTTAPGVAQTSTAPPPSTSEPSDPTTIPTTSPSTTPTTSVTTVPSSLVTVTTVDDTPPTTQPGDPDWVAIVQGLYDTLDDINADPSVERIDEFCVPVESPCRDAQGAQIEALARDGWRVIEVGQTPVISAEFVSTADGLPPSESTLVVLEVEVGQPEAGGRVIDDEGNTMFVIDVESAADGRVGWFLRSVDGDWRVFEIR